MSRMPAQPSLASFMAAFTAPSTAPGTASCVVLVGALAVLVAAPACIFVPPPLLPEEIAALEASKAARKGAAKAVTPPAGSTAGDAEPGAGTEMTFKKGDEAPRGMNAAQLRAYNAAQGDPEASEFTLDEALAGLGGQGDELWAQLKTPRGVIECQLFADKTPGTVANFVGLARGLRPSYDKATDSWVKRPYYNDTGFHRVIPGFMIQGGDPSGTGTGNPGFVIEDEIRPDLIHDAPGVLSMANKGPNTGSAQFFITLNPTPHLDGLHTVFGLCSDEGTRLADDIALVPRGEQDKPKEPETLETISIVRRASKR
jgi:peptidyl-prolyl cis-trans isomerase A (cyclophilin A)